MILLDTQVLLWFTEGHSRLGRKARTIVREAEDTAAVAISAMSFWEIGMLVEKRRIGLSMPVALYAETVRNNRNIRILPVDMDVAIESSRLPGGLPGDPGDRLIAATARSLGWTLLTSDRELLDYATAGHLQAIDARL